MLPWYWFVQPVLGDVSPLHLLIAIAPWIGTVWVRPKVFHRYWLTAVALYSRNPERRARAERLLNGPITDQTSEVESN